MKKSVLIVVVCAAFGLKAFAQEAAKVPITRVAPDSAAARAGLRPGFAVKRIDGAETAKMQREIIAQMNKNPLIRD